MRRAKHGLCEVGPLIYWIPDSHHRRATVWTAAPRSFFAHNWTLPSYNWVSLLAVVFGSFLLTVGVFFACSGKVRLTSTLTDCKERSSTVSERNSNCKYKIPLSFPGCFADDPEDAAVSFSSFLLRLIFSLFSLVLPSTTSFGTGKGVITKGVFSLEKSLESLKSLKFSRFVRGKRSHRVPKPRKIQSNEKVAKKWLWELTRK